LPRRSDAQQQTIVCGDRRFRASLLLQILCHAPTLPVPSSDSTHDRRGFLPAQPNQDVRAASKLRAGESRSARPAHPSLRHPLRSANNLLFPSLRVPPKAGKLRG
jgi:hypothetical protein